MKIASEVFGLWSLTLWVETDPLSNKSIVKRKMRETTSIAEKDYLTKDSH